MSFNQLSYGVMEDDSTVTITIILSQPSSLQFQVVIHVIEASAIGRLIIYVHSYVVSLLSPYSPV